MSIKKLLLASAIAAVSSTGFAMEAMDDSVMSDTAGQAGLDVTLVIPTLSFSAVLHDTDGYTGQTSAGAIVIGDPLAAGGSYVKASIATPASGIKLVIDASGDGDSTTTGNQPVLQIGTTIAAGTVIHTGTLSVATSAGLGNPITNQSAVLLKDMTITLGATTANMQLGNAPQGALIVLNTVMTGGLTVAGFALSDVSASGGGSIGVSNLAIKDTGGADLTVKANVSATTTGLKIAVAQLGSATGMSLQMTGVTLGSATSIGNVDVIGLNMNNTTVTVAGH